jgi:hypothetical protein
LRKPRDDLTLGTRESSSLRAASFGESNGPQKEERAGHRPTNVVGERPFTVACSADKTPKILATGTRTIVNGANSLPFNLSLTSGAAADDLPATLALAATLTVVQDGTAKVVPLYARLAKANFGSLPAGAYANGSAVTVSVAY